MHLGIWYKGSLLLLLILRRNGNTGMNAENIGPTALSVELEMEQVFIARPDRIKEAD